MHRRVLLFRNLTDNLPKNTGLYLVGVMFLLLFRFTIDLLQILMGLLAFLVSYSSIYVLNDLFDVEEDKMDERKILRKPMALGVVNKPEAVLITITFLTLGLLISFLLNLFFLCVIVSLVFINLIYSIQLTNTRKKSQEDASPKALKHTRLGLLLILLMQILKIFLPWTLSDQVMQFPFLFAIGFSLLYVILFKGYKEYLTIGQSVMKAPFSIGFAGAFFISSLGIYPEPLSQASIILYILAGIVVFRNSHLTDRKVLMLGPVYILVGIITLFCLISSM